VNIFKGLRKKEGGERERGERLSLGKNLSLSFLLSTLQRKNKKIFINSFIKRDPLSSL